MSATLGGLIKDLRLQKNISQLEIAFALGWKEPSRLSRIEQGKNTSPPRFLIENIIEAMRLSEEEKNQLLVSGNYLPSREEIDEALNKIRPVVDGWPFPASALDYTWRIVYTNKILYGLYNIPLKQQKEMEAKLPWINNVVFGPNFPANKTESDEELKVRKEFLIRMLMQFQHAQRTRTREKWYQDHIKHMMDNKWFRELWPKAQQRGAFGYDITNFAQKTIKKYEGKKKIELTFYFFVMPVFGDPRFFIELYLPANLETFKYFQR